MTTRKVHNNIILNHKHAYKQRFQEDCPLSDKEIAGIVSDNEMCHETNADEDAAVLFDMRYKATGKRE